MDIIRCVIVEDEKRTRNVLKTLLEKYCEGVEVVAEAENIQEAVAVIKEHQPGLVFLDIEMPRESGFSLFKYFQEIDFEVVFTTAYDQYAVKAIKLAALDYLVKPINLEELMETLERFRTKIKKVDNSAKQHQLLEDSLHNKGKQKIALSCIDGLMFIEVTDIVRCQSDKSYTVIVLASGQEIWTSKNLGEYESILDEANFFRVHRSHIINTNYVTKLTRGKTPILLMKDGSKIPVSLAKKEKLLKILLE
ncbi:LytR/AlgR family response regulator transcription factor [Aureispira anguillae]|uniref:LytTR family DNA-binding domain-containing protein n=1 Tax=Aureispira anguillae TaxID=2864201 RepID=A0A915YBB1_9BACT|nr:LytTR family DNA-binding domain-containing protein [Aureispira anguillae]BDS09933.1 LytTR family DNA-binding domain-containing protein [Aureispira anguillae]